jgi:hypothetical protein
MQVDRVNTGLNSSESDVQITGDYHGTIRGCNWIINGNVFGTVSGFGCVIRGNLHGTLSGKHCEVTGNVHGLLSGTNCTIRGFLYGKNKGVSCTIENRVVNVTSVADISRRATNQVQKYAAGNIVVHNAVPYIDLENSISLDPHFIGNVEEFVKNTFKMNIIDNFYSTEEKKTPSRWLSEKLPPYDPNKDDEKPSGEKDQCSICMERKKQCVNTPCGHADCCLKCIWQIHDNMVNDKSKKDVLKCSSCRKEVEKVIRIYL